VSRFGAKIHLAAMTRQDGRIGLILALLLSLCAAAAVLVGCGGGGGDGDGFPSVDAGARCPQFTLRRQRIE